jgi:hypothetical protein
MQASLTNMSAIAAAVTPVVMISANAILIGAISSKHQAMSDRLRALATEWRTGNVTPARREAIRTEVRLFANRIVWISRAHFLLYVATACFIAMVLVIALQLDFLSLPLLLAGVFVMLTAIFFEMLDLRKAQATLEVETRELT